MVGRATNYQLFHVTQRILEIGAAVTEPDETWKIDRVERPRGARHVVFMAVAGLAGWAALILGSLSTSWSSGAYPATGTAFASFLAIVVAMRVMAFRTTPETPISLDSSFYIAAVVCLGALPAGWLVAVAMTLDALLRFAGVDAAARRLRAGQTLLERITFVLYFGGMTGGVILGIGLLFGAHTAAGDLALMWRVFAAGILLLVVHYLVRGIRLTLSGQDWRALLLRMALPGILSEASLLPLAVVVVLVYDPARPLGFVLLGATYLLINFVFNRLTDAGERLQQRVGELETLNRTARALASTLDRHELVETIGRETLEAVPEAELFTLAHREHVESVHFVVDWLDREAGRFERLRARADEGISGRVIRSRRPVLVGDLRDEDVPVTGDPGIRSWLGVPILVYDQVVGVLSVQSRRRGAFGEAQQRVLEAISSQAAVAIQNARLYELATIDGLTGLYVRRYFDSRLREELERSRRFASPFSVVLVDIDDFKHTNDTFGHAVGDRVLRDVAQSMRRNLRGVDIPARYGGEEFAFILPRTGILDAHAVAERIRHDVTEVRVAHEGRVIRVTVSLGIACYADGAPNDVATLLARADAALYRAKAAGKDRVELFLPEEKTVVVSR